MENKNLQIENSLLVAASKYRTIFEHAPDAIVVLDLQTGHFVDFNPQAVKLFDAPGDLLRDYGPVHLSPEYQPDGRPSAVAAREYIDQAVAGKVPAFEWVHQTIHGKPVLCEVRLVKLPDEERLLIRGSISDITERVRAREMQTLSKKSEEALRQSEARLRKFVDSSLIGMAFWNADGSISDANDSYLNIIGYSRQDLKEGRFNWREITPPEYTAIDDRALESLRRDGRCDTFEKEYIRKDGTRVPVLVGGVLENEPGRGVAFVLDISERKRAGEVLRESEERFRSAFDSAPIGMALVAPDGRWLRVNQSLCNIVGYTPDELLTIDFQTITHPEDLTADLGYVQQMLDGTIATYDMEKRYFHKSGRIVWILLSVSLLRDPRGQPLYFISQIQDITARRQIEEALRKAHDSLEQRVAERTTELAAVNKELEAFAYSVSHDLRAPLRAIDAFGLALLEDNGDRLDEDGKKYLAIIRKETSRMGQLIDDLLTLSRVSRAGLKREPIDLTAMAREVLAALQGKQPERKVRCTVQEGLKLVGDPGLMRIVMENLLGNAWKFTGNQPQADIEVGCEPWGGLKTYYVKDNGAGFDMTYVGKLFGAFQRLHPMNEFEGTGIGLATVQRVIRRHGGQVFAEGAVERGATFRFAMAESVATSRPETGQIPGGER